MRGALTDPEIVVLKFGSSILSSPEGFSVAAREVGIELRRGRRCLAVVSARPGVTDALWRSAREVDANPAEALLCSLLATGENASAALLGLALDRDGIDSRALTHLELGIEAEGPRLSAGPVSVDSRRVLRQLCRSRTLVVPGFACRHRQGDTCVLGRGGSDLTALLLAHHLGAGECRLVKDVDGLHLHDPNAEAPSTNRRYVQASWDDVDQLGGGLVQRQALSFARRHGVGFRVAAPGSTGTWIGPGPSLLASEALSCTG